MSQSMFRTDRVIERLRVYLERFAHRLTDSDGRLDDLFVSVAELRHAIGTQRAEGTSPPAASRPDGIEELGGIFGLDETERELLMLAAAPGLSPAVARLYTFAWADFAVKMPTVAFLSELAGDADDFDARVNAFRPRGPLVCHGLVELHQAEHWKGRTPLIHRSVSVPEAILSRLRGADHPIDDFGATGDATGAPADGELVMASAIRDAIAQAWQASLDGGRPLYLLGARGAGRRSLLARLCADGQRPLWVVDGRRIPAAAVGEAWLGITRAARIERAGVVLRVPADGLADEAVDGIRRALVRTPIPLALTAGRIDQNLRAALRTATPIEVPPTEGAAQRALWRRLLDDPARADRLAERLSMSPGAIVDAAREAQGVVDDGGDDPCAVYLQTRLDHALDAVAEPVATSLTWADVVLPDDVRQTLEEIRSQARHRARVFDDWGFRRKMAYGRGLSCLFAGPPGTGKTMMAGIIANDLRRVMYRVDLSRVVSKWIGETEKNLARVFDEAERAQVILFFDEADSLFSKRTEVKGSNDRFANMEVNYLLQRMEHFDGISILTTNFERSLDEAFKRRLRFRVHFTLPDAEQRAALWQRMVPAAMAVDDDIDWRTLGRRFKFSGGTIKNAVLRAAFYAAEGEERLTQRLLLRAGEAERREMGHL